MQGPGAAIGKQRKTPQIVAAFGRNRSDRARHAGIGDAQDALGRALERQTERPRHLLVQDAARGREVNRQPAAEQSRGVESAEHKIGVRDCRERAAAPISSRAGIGPSAFRPDLQRAGIVESRDAATASADDLNVDHRHAHGIAGDSAFRGEGRPP